MQYKIIIAGENALLMHGLSQLLNNDQSKQFVISQQVGIEDIYSLSLDFDMLIIVINARDDMFNIHLPFISNFYAKSPDKKLVLISGINDSCLFFRSRKYVNGMLSERDSLQEIETGISTIFSGKDYISPAVTHFQSPERHNKKTSVLRKQLSEREDKVLKYLFSGYNVTETARMLNRSIKTISAQKRHAMKKLGVESDAELLSIGSVLRREEVFV